MDLALSTFLNPSGLSWVGQDYFRCFSSRGIRTVPVWIAPPEMETKDALDPALAEEMLAAASKPLGDGPLQFHAGRADEVRALKGRSALVGSVVLEGNRLNADQARIVRALDAVLVPSRFCYAACASSGVPRNRVHLFPYALDAAAWNPSVAPAAPRGGRFRFLYMNTLYERKGWDLLLRAFWEEFSADEPVELVLKSYRENDRRRPLNVAIAIEAARLGVDRSRRAPVSPMDRLMPAKDIPAFMRGFDAYVSPHRSEGFGLNIWHAMALGVPTVCTDYGGNTDFAKADTAWLVRGSGFGRPSARELAIFPHLEGTTWVEPDVPDLRRQMRACMSNPAEAARRAGTGAALVARNYGYDRVMQALEYVLKRNAPGAWERLRLNRTLESLSTQPSPRFESAEKPIEMMEI